MPLDYHGGDPTVCIGRACGVAEGTSPGRNVKNVIAKSHRRWKRQENVLIYSVFIYFLYAPLLLMNCPWFRVFIASNAHGLLQVWGRLALFTSLLLIVVYPPLCLGLKQSGMSIFFYSCTMIRTTVVLTHTETQKVDTADYNVGGSKLTEIYHDSHSMSPDPI